MKYIDADGSDDLPGRKLRDDDTFFFQCHPDVPCFNRCCHNLNLFLYPYDVIRLKKRLNITSDQFIDQYVDIVLRPSDFFPEVLLRMTENEEKTCSFLTASGCSVYSDRPDTCRNFPFDQGILYDAERKNAERVHFFRPPDFCMGLHEKKEWTILTWIKDQEAETYNKMTTRWAEMKRLFQDNPWGREGPGGAKGKMAFMAAYNMDEFRNFVFKSSFLEKFRIKSGILKKIRKDDADLLLLGFDWIKFFIWGMKPKYFKLR